VGADRLARAKPWDHQHCAERQRRNRRGECGQPQGKLWSGEPKRLGGEGEALEQTCEGEPAGVRTRPEQQALSRFGLEDDVVYHTYSTFARGVEIMMGFYLLLDRAPQGRNESGDSEFWIRRHDEY
jgi:hypothetical protein